MKLTSTAAWPVINNWTRFLVIKQAQRNTPMCTHDLGIICQTYMYTMYNTHTHTRLTALFPGLPRWAGTRKVKPIWILLKQEPVSGSGISWDICKSAPHSRQITTPAPHHSVFLQAGCPSCRPTNSVKAHYTLYNRCDLQPMADKNSLNFKHFRSLTQINTSS